MTAQLFLVNQCFTGNLNNAIVQSTVWLADTPNSRGGHQ